MRSGRSRGARRGQSSTYGAGELVVGAGRDGVLVAGREGAGAVFAGCDGVSQTTGADCCGAGAGGGDGGGGGGFARLGAGGGLVARFWFWFWGCGWARADRSAAGAAGAREVEGEDSRAGADAPPELRGRAGGEPADRVRRADERLGSDLAGCCAAGCAGAVSAVLLLLGG